MKAISTLAALITSVSIIAAEAPAHVKLFYGPHEPGEFFSSCIEVEKSAPGTFFESCGFDRGFAGIYEKLDKTRGMVLRIWDVDGGRDNPDKVKERKRATVVNSAKVANNSRFGNDGSGAMIFFPYKWKEGTNYTFAIKAQIDDKETKFTAWFCDKANNRWERIGAIKVANAGIEHMKGYYSSIHASPEKPVVNQARKAFFTNPWLKQKGGKWMQFITGDFTSEPPENNTNAGNTINDQFFLETGGNTLKKVEFFASFSIAEQQKLPDNLQGLINSEETK